MSHVLTSLGEEGTEALICISGLTFLCEVSIRLFNSLAYTSIDLLICLIYLDAVLEAIELQEVWLVS